MVFRRDGIIRPYPAARLTEYGVPRSVLQTYWQEMGAIAPEFVPAVSDTGNDLGKLLSIEQVTKHKTAILAVFERLANAVAATHDE